MSQQAFVPPKRQIVNAAFTSMIMATTGNSPDNEPSVVVATKQGGTVPDGQKYFEIKVASLQGGDQLNYIYQNAQTGGYISVDAFAANAKVIESTTATLWSKEVGREHVKLSPAKQYYGGRTLYIRLNEGQAGKALELSHEPGSTDIAQVEWTIIEN